jgi:hypothetical protein
VTRPIPDEHVTHLVGLLIKVVKDDKRPFTHSNMRRLLKAFKKALKELEL